MQWRRKLENEVWKFSSSCQEEGQKYEFEEKNRDTLFKDETQWQRTSSKGTKVIPVIGNFTWIGDAVPGLVVNINCHRPSIKLELVCPVNTFSLSITMHRLSSNIITCDHTNKPLKIHHYSLDQTCLSELLGSALHVQLPA